MTEREKIVKGLEEAFEVIAAYVPERYWGYSLNACKDALALLKAQEPVKPTWRWDYAYCGECGFHLHWMVEKNNYCPECGRKVKWE